MTPRPSKLVIALMGLGLLVAVAVAVLADGASDWDLGLLATLAAISIVSDLMAVHTRVRGVSISASFLTIVIAAVFLGGGPAAVMGAVTIIAGWIKDRYAPDILLLNTFTYACFPLVAGLVFHVATDELSIGVGTPLFYLLIFGVFVLALLIDFALIAGYMC